MTPPSGTQFKLPLFGRVEPNLNLFMATNKLKSWAAEAYFFCCDIACMLLAGKSGNRCQRAVTLLYRSGCAVMARYHMDGYHNR